MHQGCVTGINTNEPTFGTLRAARGATFLVLRVFGSFGPRGHLGVTLSRLHTETTAQSWSAVFPSITFPTKTKLTGCRNPRRLFVRVAMTLNTLNGPGATPRVRQSLVYKAGSSSYLRADSNERSELRAPCTVAVNLPDVLFFQSNSEGSAYFRASFSICFINIYDELRKKI